MEAKELYAFGEDVKSSYFFFPFFGKESIYYGQDNFDAYVDELVLYNDVAGLVSLMADVEITQTISKNVFERIVNYGRSSKGID